MAVTSRTAAALALLALLAPATGFTPQPQVQQQQQQSQQQAQAFQAQLRQQAAARAHAAQQNAQPQNAAQQAAIAAADAPATAASVGAGSNAQGGFTSTYTQGYQGGGGGGPDEALLSEHLLTLVSLAGVDSQAVCNDGSPGAYYFQPGSDASQWVIYLQGGMWCWDQASCDARYAATKFEMSSTGWARTQQVGGIFSTDPANPWANANKVYLSYCSSDAWIGDVGASAATYNYAFRGQRIIAATVAALVANHGLDGSANVLFGGCSAGARGAMFNLDYVSDMLPAGATVKGLLDSGLWLDIAPLDSSEVTLQQQTQAVVALVSPSARLPPACAAANPGAEWKCFYGQYRLAYLTTPYLINAAQFDSFQMLYDMDGNPPRTTGQVAFADEFQAATLVALQTAVAAGQAVFSTTCLVHCLTADTEDFTQFDAGGVSIAAALQQWYFEGETPVDISTCTGYPCVQQCPGGNSITAISQASKSYAALQAAAAEGSSDTAGSGSEVNGVWVSRQAGMGFGGTVGGTPSAAGSQDKAATGWMTMGRRMLR